MELVDWGFRLPAALSADVSVSRPTGQRHTLTLLRKCSFNPVFCVLHVFLLAQGPRRPPSAALRPSHALVDDERHSSGVFSRSSVS